jgi:astacin
MGCWSYVGRIGGEQRISIGATCYRHGVIIHEILHALGFFHEHSRPDRDQYVDINYENVREGMNHNFMKLSSRKWFNMTIPYDTNSVLHYSGYAFAADRSTPSMFYKDTKEAVRAQRDRLSEWDTAQVCISYRCNHCKITTEKERI